MLNPAFERRVTPKGGGVFYTRPNILCARCRETKDTKGSTKRGGMTFCADCSPPKEAKK